MSGEVFKQPLLLPQCPLCLLEMISSSITPTAVLSKIPNTLLLLSSTVSHFIPVCNYCNADLLEFESHFIYTRSPGVFKRILPLASSHSLRVICLSRREYEGSTPYSPDELKIINHGSDAERADFIHNEGVLIALFVDRLIQLLSLPEKGGVAIMGWSLGNLFTIAMRASINDLPDNTKQRLKAYMRGFIIFGLFLRRSS